MIEAQNWPKSINDSSTNGNDINIMETDNYITNESPDNMLNKLNIDSESLKNQAAKIEFEIKEQSLNRQILSLERRALLAEEENIKLTDRIKQVEQDLLQQQSLNDKSQLDLIQSQTDYNNLLSKLKLSFNCDSIEEVFKCSDKIMEMESKISHLTQDLEQTQIQLSEIKIKSIDDKTIDPVSEAINSISIANKNEIDRLTYQLKRSNDKISIQNQEIEFLKSQINDIKKNNENIQSEYSQIKANSSNFEQENQELQKANKQLFDEYNEFKSKQSKEFDETIKRLKFLNQVSQRLGPKFLMINDQNVLFPIFDNLSMLLQSISDIEVESQIIVQGLMEMSNVVQNATNEIDQKISNQQNDIEEKNRDNETINQLKNQIQRLQDDLQEMYDNDTAPELLTWISKYKKLEQELIALKHTQNQNQNINNFSQSPLMQSNLKKPAKQGCSVFLQKPT